jgi:hypothetical protein
MALVVKLRPTYSKLIGLTDKFGLRYYDVQLVTRTFTKPSDSPFTGPYSGDGYMMTQVVIDILEANGQRPNVKKVKEKTFAAGVPEDSELVLIVTRDYTDKGGGGYTAETLQSISTDPNVQIYYLIKGPGLHPDGSRFVQTGLTMTGLTYHVNLRRVSEGS